MTNGTDQQMTIAEADLEEELARVKQIINQAFQAVVADAENSDPEPELTEADLKECAKQLIDWLRAFGVNPPGI